VALGGVALRVGLVECFPSCDLRGEHVLAEPEAHVGHHAAHVRVLVVLCLRKRELVDHAHERVRVERTEEHLVEQGIRDRERLRREIAPRVGLQRQ
jgi:hypothetical protein